MAAWEAIIILPRTDQLHCRCSEAEAAIVEWLDVVPDRRTAEQRAEGVTANIAPRVSADLF